MPKQLLGTAVCCLLMAATSCERAKTPEPPFESAAAFQETTNVVFTEFSFGSGAGGQKKRFSVSASNDLARITSAVRLQRKDPCACAHVYDAYFQTPSAQIHVSFCDHCFDVLGTKDSYEGARLYTMPVDFYSAFREIAQNREHWHVLSP